MNIVEISSQRGMIIYVKYLLKQGNSYLIEDLDKNLNITDESSEKKINFNYFENFSKKRIDFVEKKNIKPENYQNNIERRYFYDNQLNYAQKSNKKFILEKDFFKKLFTTNILQNKNNINFNSEGEYMNLFDDFGKNQNTFSDNRPNDNLKCFLSKKEKFPVKNTYYKDFEKIKIISEDDSSSPKLLKESFINFSQIVESYFRLKSLTKNFQLEVKLCEEKVNRSERLLDDFYCDFLYSLGLKNLPERSKLKNEIETVREKNNNLSELNSHNLEINTNQGLIDTVNKKNQSNNLIQKKEKSNFEKIERKKICQNIITKQSFSKGFLESEEENNSQNFSISGENYLLCNKSRYSYDFQGKNNLFPYNKKNKLMNNLAIRKKYRNDYTRNIEEKSPNYKNDKGDTFWSDSSHECKNNSNDLKNVSLKLNLSLASENGEKEKNDKKIKNEDITISCSYFDSSEINYIGKSKKTSENFNEKNRVLGKNKSLNKKEFNKNELQMTIGSKTNHKSGNQSTMDKFRNEYFSDEENKSFSRIDLTLLLNKRHQDKKQYCQQISSNMSKKKRKTLNIDDSVENFKNSNQQQILQKKQKEILEISSDIVKTGERDDICICIYNYPTPRREPEGREKEEDWKIGKNKSILSSESDGIPIRKKPEYLKNKKSSSKSMQNNKEIEVSEKTMDILNKNNHNDSIEIKKKPNYRKNDNNSNSSDIIQKLKNNQDFFFSDGNKYLKDKINNELVLGLNFVPIGNYEDLDFEKEKCSIFPSSKIIQENGQILNMNEYQIKTPTTQLEKEIEFELSGEHGNFWGKPDSINLENEIIYRNFENYPTSIPLDDPQKKNDQNTGWYICESSPNENWDFYNQENYQKDTERIFSPEMINFCNILKNRDDKPRRREIDNELLKRDFIRFSGNNNNNFSSEISNEKFNRSNSPNSPKLQRYFNPNFDSSFNIDAMEKDYQRIKNKICDRQKKKNEFSKEEIAEFSKQSIGIEEKEKILRENPHITIHQRGSHSIPQRKKNKFANDIFKSYSEKTKKFITDKKCFRCNKEGHSNYNCDEEIKSWCKSCQNLNHKAEDCLIKVPFKYYLEKYHRESGTICLNCKERGHLVCKPIFKYFVYNEEINKDKQNQNFLDELFDEMPEFDKGPEIKNFDKFIIVEKDLKYCAICKNPNHKTSKCDTIVDVFKDMNYSRFRLKEHKARVIERNKYHFENGSDLSMNFKNSLNYEPKPSKLANRKSFIGSSNSSFDVY